MERKMTEYEKYLVSKIEEYKSKMPEFPLPYGVVEEQLEKQIKDYQTRLSVYRRGLADANKDIMDAIKEEAFRNNDFDDLHQGEKLK
jgi:hypothetical protein